MANRKFKKT